MESLREPVGQMNPMKRFGDPSSGAGSVISRLG